MSAEGKDARLHPLPREIGPIADKDRAEQTVASAADWHAMWPNAFGEKTYRLLAYEAKVRAMESALAAERQRVEEFERQIDDIERTLEGAEVPFYLADDDEATPLGRTARVEWLSEARDAVEYELEATRQRVAAAEQRMLDLTTRITMYSPAEALVLLAEDEIRRLSSPERQPVFGPLAAHALAVEKGRDLLRSLMADRADKDARIAARPEPQP